MTLDGLAGRRVVVAGGLGFIGLNLVRRLAEERADVLVVARGLPHPGSVAARVLEELGGRVAVLAGDLADSGVAEGAVAHAAAVFDLAGRSGPADSNRAPIADLDDNCRAQLVLLEACRRQPAPPRVVFASSRLVYAPHLPLPVAEDAPLAPASVYGVHKLTTEHYLRLYRHLHGVPAAILRITNPYGPFHPAGRSGYGVVNWMLERALGGQPLTIYGDGAQLRDYVHIDDVVDALLLGGIHPGAEGQVLNVGAGRGISFAEMARRVVEAVGAGSITHTEWPAAAAAVETGDFVADITAMERRTGWRPRLGLEEGLERTLRALGAGGRMRDLSAGGVGAA